jgi:hypothetical protein
MSKAVKGNFARLLTMLAAMVAEIVYTRSLCSRQLIITLAAVSAPFSL